MNANPVRHISLKVAINVFALLLASAAGHSVAAASPSVGSQVGVRRAYCDAKPVYGPVRHVSLAGDDATGDGSLGRPYKTIRRAIETASADETIVLREGTYPESTEVRLRLPGITIRSYPGEWAIIDRTVHAENDSGVYFDVGSDFGVLECIEVKGGFYVVSTETRWEWGDPNNRSGSSSLRIENARLHNSDADVIKIKPNSDDIIIRNNEIFNSGVAQAAEECNAEGIDNVNGDRTLVVSNHIHDICSTGVYLKGGATDGVIEFNLIERTGGAGVLLGFDTSPEFFDTTVNPGYYENFLGVVRNNLIRDTGWAGIGFYAANGARAHHNTIINAASIYHSPLYFGITFQDWDPLAGRPPNRDINFRNNIVVNLDVQRQTPLVDIRYSSELSGLSALEGALDIGANCYYNKLAPAQFADQRTAWSGDLAGWRSHISGDVDSIEQDPMLDSNNVPANTACTGSGHASSNNNDDPPPVLVGRVQSAYVAYYGRPADPAGLDYWAAQLSARKGDLSAIIQGFGHSEEFSRRYGALSGGDLIDAIFQQMFGRAPDTDGRAFYLGKLNSGELSLQSITLDVLNGAQNDDEKAITRKLAVAGQYTQAVRRGCAYQSETAAKGLLDNVNATTQSALDAIEAVFTRCPGTR